MKLTKTEVLQYLRNAQLAEYALYCADLVNPIEHVQMTTALQKLEHRAEMDRRSVFEVDE